MKSSQQFGSQISATDKENVSRTSNSNNELCVDTIQLPGSEETASTSRANIVISRLDPGTGERKDYTPPDSSPTITQGNDKSHAFTLRKTVYLNPSDNGGNLDIINPHLWDLLKTCLGHYPYHIFQGSPIPIDSPFEPLIHNWDKLERATKEKPKDDIDKQARSDLKLLLDTISTSSGDPKVDEYFQIREIWKEQRSITFETLWTIFPPGALIYGQPFQGQDQVFIVQNNTSSRSRRIWAVQSLTCWTYDWDGRSFKRMSLRLFFEHFDGHKPITSLPYYPLEFNEQYTTMKKQLIERGKTFRQFCTTKQGSRMFEYHGKAILVQKGFSGVQGDEGNVWFLFALWSAV